MIAVIADIHANLPALEAILARIDDLGCEQIVCLGDIIGYGAQVNECVELVRQRCRHCVAGNHDSAAVGSIDFSYFRDEAKQAIELARTTLTPENLDYLTQRPDEIQLTEHILCVHGAPGQQSRYLNDRFALAAVATALRTERGPGLCLVGHTHSPLIYDQDLQIPIDGVVYPLDETGYAIVNPGSVGQPRDRNPEAAFGLIDLQQNAVTFHRVAYDIPAAVKAIAEAGLPAFSYERLLAGR